MFECGSQKQCPLPLSVSNVEQNATCGIFTWTMRKPFPFCRLNTAPLCWEFLVGLSPRWITSPLKALGSVCAVTLGSWESGGGWKALKPQRPMLQRGWQASPGTQKVNTDSQGFPLDITNSSRGQGWPTQGWKHRKGTGPNLICQCSPEKEWGLLWGVKWPRQPPPGVLCLHVSQYHNLTEKRQLFKTVPVQRCHHAKWGI